ncbi:MAG TPA: cation diffusion facilitator family transporter [Verrucomicrobiota bacterium]|nr:cation diffusion facilitator family transporter [Verrucomicrobiota bacterium]
MTRFAWLSIGTAVLTIGLRTVAYLITGSVGLLADAAESLVNLLGAVMALAMLTIAARPADEDHAHGHGKAEYFSSGLEGGLILVASVGIAVAAGMRLLRPQPLEAVGMGLTVSAIAALANLLVAVFIARAARRHDSITLAANAQHLFADVWTSLGILVGVGLVALTGWHWLDPLVALIVAANIARAAVGIMRQSVAGLMDASLSAADLAAVRQVFHGYAAGPVKFHALRTRQAGAQKFISVHVLVPGDWTVQRGHELLETIESQLRRTVANAVVFTHLESLEDPASWEDEELER